jgi:hypothetical protein
LNVGSLDYFLHWRILSASMCTIRKIFLETGSSFKDLICLGQQIQFLQVNIILKPCSNINDLRTPGRYVIRITVLVLN